MQLNEEVKILIQEQKEKKAAQYRLKKEINNAPKLDSLNTMYK